MAAPRFSSVHPIGGVATTTFSLSPASYLPPEQFLKAAQVIFGNGYNRLVQQLPPTKVVQLTADSNIEILNAR